MAETVVGKDRLSELTSMRERGMTYREIANIVGVTYQRVQQLLGGGRLSKEVRHAKAFELLDQGLCRAEIAERLSMPYGKLCNILRRPRVILSPEKRFFKYVNKTETCWLWTGGTTPEGYGRFGLSTGKHLYTHRYSYELHCGPIPAGMEVCHTCDNPACVRPDHLFLGTHTDNMHDRDAKGRGRGGPNAPHKYCKPRHVEAG